MKNKVAIGPYTVLYSSERDRWYVDGAPHIAGATPKLCAGSLHKKLLGSVAEVMKDIDVVLAYIMEPCEMDQRSPEEKRPDLRGANLTRADLRGADLRDVNLSSTRLDGADLRGVLLDGATRDGSIVDVEVIHALHGSTGRCSLCEE